MEDKPYKIRALAEEDAGLVGSLFRVVYGDDYPYIEVYKPEDIRLTIRERRLRAFLATDPAGRPVGYFAQAKTAPNPGLWEESGLIVDPEYKYTNLALELTGQFLAAGLSAHDGIFSQAVCHHYFSQMVCVKGGRIDCALGLDQLDGSIFREREAENRRVSLLHNFSEYSNPIAPVYLPPEYADILRQLASPLRPRVFLSANEPLPSDGVTVKTVKYLSTVRSLAVSVREVGADWPTVLEELLRDVARLGIISLQVTINAHRPSLGAAVALLRRKGFFFSGLSPRWFGSDGIVMQQVFVKEPDYEGIKLYTQTARELLSFIRADREAVGILAETPVHNIKILGGITNMTTLEKVGQIVLKFKKGKVAAEALKASADLKKDLGLDSLDLTELVVLTEDAFKVSIPLEDGMKMRTLGDVAQYIDKKLSA